jgi:hypothetical protein
MRVLITGPEFPGEDPCRRSVEPELCCSGLYQRGAQPHGAGRCESSRDAARFNP